MNPEGLEEAGAGSEALKGRHWLPRLSKGRRSQVGSLGDSTANLEGLVEADPGPEALKGQALAPEMVKVPGEGGGPWGHLGSLEPRLPLMPPGGSRVLVMAAWQSKSPLPVAPPGSRRVLSKLVMYSESLELSAANWRGYLKEEG